MRRLGQGRLSEIVPPRLVGSGLVDTDRTMRGLGLYRTAADSVNALSPAMRAIIDAYAAGVNAWLAPRRPAIRPRAHRHQAAVGRPLPAGSLAAGQFAGVGQADGARARRQLARRTAAAAPRAQDRRGWCEVPDRGAGREPRLDAVARQRGAERYRSRPALRRHRQYRPRASARLPTNGCCRALIRFRASRCSPTIRISPCPSPAPGTSRAWSGPASTSAAPPRPARPPSCSATTARSAGASPPPTSTARTCSSSAIDPTDPNRYITPDGARPFGVRDETINVAWGDPVTMRVRETRHGPVIDDFMRRADDLTPTGPRAGAAGHRARRQRHLGRGLRPHRPGAELGRFPERRPQDRLAHAEHGLRRHRRGTSA